MLAKLRVLGHFFRVFGILGSQALGFRDTSQVSRAENKKPSTKVSYFAGLPFTPLDDEEEPLTVKDAIVTDKTVKNLTPCISNSAFAFFTLQFYEIPQSVEWARTESLPRPIPLNILMAFLLGCRTAIPVEKWVEFLRFIIFIFFRVGKSLACHFPAKWCLCA